MLHLHLANRHETLLGWLLQRLAEAGGDAFAAEPVIVPNAAHRRRLSLAIADAFGVCANVEFAYLARWLWQQVARVVAQVGDESPFAAAPLTWRVWRAFGDEPFVGAHPRLRTYLSAGDAAQRHELAVRAAALIEQYVTYRADWLQAWAAGNTVPALAAAAADEAWQAALWRRLLGEAPAGTAHPRQAFAAALQRSGAQLARDGVLPARLHLFALPSIAPLHLQMLQPLAAQVEVHVYAADPCREHWHEIVAPRRLHQLQAQGRAAHHELGNRLLASWGVATREHLEALDALCTDDAEVLDGHAPAQGTTLLAAVQNAVLDLRDLQPASQRLDAGDRSLELHVCHSLARELEVLQDHLLGLFAADETLRPSDIVVLVPDLDAAAPLIDAVFGSAPKDRRIDYTLAARPASRANQPARALLALLALAASRCTATEVFALLQQPVVARRFGLDDEALQRVRDWLRQSGFRWALDAQQVAALDLPADARHTLAHALQRLFLGHALPEDAAAPFGDLLPAGGAEGSDALHLGALWRFALALQRARERLADAAPPGAWVARLHTLLDDFVDAEGDEADELRELHEAIATASAPMQQAAPDEALPLAVVRAALAAVLDEPARGGAPGGALTFGSLRALRALPYPVVCAIGLDDGAFPAPQRPAEFDLIATAPRRGDRRPRDEERATMLDVLLAARRSLYLSHTGRSQRDNTELPPSVLVAELLEAVLPAIADDASPEALARARRRIVVEHPLQPFSIDAFRTDGSEPRVRSHDRDLADALRANLARASAAAMPGQTDGGRDEDPDDEGDDDAPADPQAPFFLQPLDPADDGWRSLTLDRLQRFFRNPCRALLRERLRIDLPRAEDELQDDEAFVADRRAARALADRLLPALIDDPHGGVDEATLEHLARCGDEAPAGAFGAQWLQQQLPALRGFAERVREAADGARLDGLSAQLKIEVDGQAWHLQVAFERLHAAGLVAWRYDEARAGDRLDAWLAHLALCAAAPAGVAARTRWFGSDGSFEFRPCADAPARLAALLRLVARGLRAPLRFFPRSAWAYVEARSLRAARRSWEPSEYHPHAEGADPAYRLALRGVDDPLDGEFEELASAVYDPLIGHLVEPPFTRRDDT